MNPLRLFEPELTARMALTLLHFLWEGTALGLAVWLVDRATRHATARTRYLMNILALVLMCGCVPVTFFVTGLSASLLPPVGGPRIVAEFAETVGQSSTAEAKNA